VQARWLVVAAVLYFCLLSPNVCSQSETTTSAVPEAAAPPKLLLLGHQQFLPGKAAARGKLEVEIARVCAGLDVPNLWIALDSITGAPEALSFDPFDSFAHLDKAFTFWGPLLATHPEINRLQDQVRTMVSSERTVIAVRRDDLGYRVADIDFSKARFLRVLEVQVRPGHESDFVEAFKMLGAAYQKISADMPWVVYQVNAGMSAPTFYAFVPMRLLKENDDLLARANSLRSAAGEMSFQRMEQIARDAYVSTESNLYSISPQMSHVSKQFAAGDPDFWTLKPAASPSNTTQRATSQATRQSPAKKPE
jgi:hypothetical protein